MNAIPLLIFNAIWIILYNLNWLLKFKTMFCEKNRVDSYALVFTSNLFQFIKEETKL